MNKILIAILIVGVIISGIILTSCDVVDLSEKAGPVTTKNYDFKDFTGIDAGYSFEVTITQSDSYSVTITAGENAFEHIDVHQDGSTLVIGVNTWFFNWFVSPKLTVTMPVLKELGLSGASRGTVSGFHSLQDLKLHLSGASKLDIDMGTGGFFAELSGASEMTGKLVAASSEIKLSGASHVNLTGSGGNIKIDGSGASSVDGVSFTVNNAYIKFSGASHANLNINGRLDVDLSGASSVGYAGNPELGDINLSGASKIERITTP